MRACHFGGGVVYLGDGQRPQGTVQGLAGLRGAVLPQQELAVLHPDAGHRRQPTAFLSPPPPFGVPLPQGDMIAYRCVVIRT